MDDEPKEIVADILSKLSIDGKKIKPMDNSLYCEHPSLTPENPINLLSRLAEDIEKMGKYLTETNYGIKQIDIIIRTEGLIATTICQNGTTKDAHYESVESLLTYLIECFNFNIEHFREVKYRIEEVARAVQNTHKIYNKIANDLPEQKK